MINWIRGSLVCGAVMVLLVFPAPKVQAGDYTVPGTVSITAGRSCQPDTIDPADTLVVTVTVDNSETDSLRNLYFCDHLPVEFFDLDTRQIRVNGFLLPDTAYVQESGAADEVFSGTRPHRWIIETPPDSAGSRLCSHILIPGNGLLEIVYAVRCTTNGQYRLPSYTWAGQLAGGDDRAVFGYCDSVFLLITGPPEPVDDLKVQKAGSRLRLSWSEPWDDLGVDWYVIYCDTMADFTSADGDSIGTTVDTFFIDPGGTVGDPGMNRFYLIRAVDVTGKRSDDSNRAGEFDKNLSNTK